MKKLSKLSKDYLKRIKWRNTIEAKEALSNINTILSILDKLIKSTKNARNRNTMKNIH